VLPSASSGEQWNRHQQVSPRPWLSAAGQTSSCGLVLSYWRSLLFLNGKHQRKDWLEVQELGSVSQPRKFFSKVEYLHVSWRHQHLVDTILKLYKWLSWLSCLAHTEEVHSISPSYFPILFSIFCALGRFCPASKTPKQFLRTAQNS
jgi:hypothetical protein